MSFTHPWILMLLAVPVLLTAWTWQHRGWGIVLPFDHHVHRPRRWLGRLLALVEVAPALVLASAILILAGPQMLRQPTQARVLTNIQICFDVSGSMTVDGRYEMARKAVERFLDQREGDAFGLTLFGSHQIRWTPLTKDLSAIRQALPFADPRRQPIHMSGTRIGAALNFCRENMVVEAVEGDRLIILVSDGFSSDLGDGFAQADVGDQLRRANITLFHVHVGSDAMPTEVADIARQTGGEAFVATDLKGIQRVFRRIDHMRPARFEPGGTVPMDHFVPFALAALAALGVHVMGLLGLRYTPW
ncbi:MAG: VWA domain-containing protein [Phycisphaerales bacterium]|nr:VWA domain-containing protein [Phycisphaerales bacterium]